LGKEYEDYFDDTIYADISNVDAKEETLKIVRAYMYDKNIKFDAIFTYYDENIQTTAYLASELGCLGIPFETSKIQNKLEFRRVCDRIGIVTPKYHLVKSEDRRNQIDILRSLDGIKSKLESGLSAQFDQLVLRLIVSVDIPFILKNPIGAGKGLAYLHLFCISITFFIVF
jgi:hypothetical protein